MPKLKRFKKAASGQGSIIDKVITRPDGSTYIRWEGYLSLGKDGNGKRKRLTVYGASQAEVLAKIDTIKRQVATGTHSEDKRTVKEYLEDWLAHKRLEVKETSIYFYKNFIDHHIVPSIGGVKLAKLTPQHIRKMQQEVLASMSADGSNKSRAVLSRALRQAVRDGLIPRNVCEATQPLKVEARKDVSGRMMRLFSFYQ